MPLSKKEFGKCMTNVTTVIDGMLVSNAQQAEMITSLVNQVSGLQLVKAEKKVEEEKKVDEDVSIV